MNSLFECFFFLKKKKLNQLHKKSCENKLSPNLVCQSKDADKEEWLGLHNWERSSCTSILVSIVAMSS